MTADHAAGMSRTLQHWHTPSIVEAGETVADALRILRRASDAWIRVATGGDGVAFLRLGKRAAVRNLEIRRGTDPMPIELHVTGDLDGMAYLGARR